MTDNITNSSAEIRTILLATDGTGYSETALKNAIRLALHHKGRLVITYFADPNDITLYDGFPCYTKEEWQAYGQNVLKTLADKARAAGLENVETILQHYQGEESLNQVASEVGADYITLASHYFGATN